MITNINNKYFFSTYYVPRTFLSTFRYVKKLEYKYIFGVKLYILVYVHLIRKKKRLLQRACIDTRKKLFKIYILDP